jgi:pimeloyl-ACP methyl ester carboxylesterase
MPAPRPILLHGVVGGPSAWAAQDGRFPGAAAIAMPGRAVGQPMEHLEDAISFVSELLERVPGPRALVGHDLGAAVALEVALRRPRLVDGVVAVACGPTLPFPDVVLTHLADDPDAQVARLLRTGLTDTGSDLARAIRAVMDAGGPDALTADIGLARQVDLRGRLGARSPPSRCCWSPGARTP